MHTTEGDGSCLREPQVQKSSTLRKCVAPIQSAAQWANSFMHRRIERIKQYVKSFRVQRGEILKLQSALRARDLDLDYAQKANERLQADIARERTAEQANRAAAVDASLEKSLAELALPLTQLATQMFLAEGEGKTLNAKDVFAVIKRLIKNAQASGLCLEGNAGEIAAFDQNRHDVIDTDGVVASGTRVKIRMPGVSYRGKIIRKAAVEPCQD